MQGIASALCLALFAASGIAAEETTLERIKREGVLRWGANSFGGAPFAFNNPDDPDETVGFEVELIERLARHLGVKPQLVPGKWELLIPNLNAGRIDLAFNGIEVKEASSREALLTVPYFRFAQQLTIRRADRSRFPDLASLKGKVAVLGGSAASVDVLKENGWDDDDIVPLDDSLKPMLAVKQGRADACLCESIIAAYYAGGEDELYRVPRTFSPGEYAGAVRIGDRDLKAELDRILLLMRQNSEMGELYQRWGIWDDNQLELGIVKGQPQELNPLARRPDRLTRTRAFHLGKALLHGTIYTIVLTAISMPLALLFGLGLALLSMSHRPWLSWPAQVYIQVIRGTPLLVQIFVIFYALPELDKALGLGGWLVWPPLPVGILCLSANYAAYEAEIHRAGIEAVPKGQREAALALGMSERQAFLHVVLPQSFRIILPPVFNDLISMLKDSCLVGVMGVAELLHQAESIGKANFLYGEMLMAAAVIYLILSLIADRLGKWIEARLKRRGFQTVQAHGQSH